MSYIGWIICMVCILTVGTLFFSVNAAALRIFSHARLLKAFKSVKKDRLVPQLVGKTEKLTLACSVYRLVCNMVILMLLLAVFASESGRVQITDYLLAFLVAAAIFLIFSLAVPQAWAKYSGERILSRTYGLLTFFAAAAWPALYIFQLYDRLARRLAGVPHTTAEEKHEEKQEEFLSRLEQRRREGVVDKEEQKMIENALKLSETTVEEIMTPRTEAVVVDLNSNLQSVLETVIAAGHSRLPVFQDNIDNIVGLVYAKDLLTEIGENTENFKLKDKLRQAYFVPETKSLRVLLREFQKQKMHIAVVLDEYGGTAGIVTIEDILEELVGEITDEYEIAQPEPIKKTAPNTIEVDARVPIDDLNEQFQFDLPEDEDYETIGGFIFSYLGCIPKTGEKFDYKNLKFTVTAAEPRRIKNVKIELVNPRP